MNHYTVSKQLVIAAVILVFGCRQEPDAVLSRQKLMARSALKNASAAFDRGDYQRAEDLLTEFVELDPGHSRGQLLLGHVFRQTNRPALAIDCYGQVAQSDTESWLLAKCFVADTWMYDLGEAGTAEAVFRDVLDRDPRHGMANQGLGMMLQIQGRATEAVPCLLKAILYGQLSVRNLIVAGWTQVPAENSEVLQKCLRVHPDDGYASLGLGLGEMYHNHQQAALEHFMRAAETHPGSAEVQAAIGQVLLSLGDSTAFEKWRTDLPVDLREHPIICGVLGIGARTEGNRAEAVRLLKVCVQADPDHPQAVYLLGRTLQEIDDVQNARRFLERAHQLEQLSLILGQIQDAGPDVSPSLLLEAANLTRRLGRPVEADGWFQTALLLQPNQAAERERKALALILKSDDITESRTDRRTRENLMTLSSPQDIAVGPNPERREWVSAEGDSAVCRFDDQAAQRNFRFRYSSGCQQPENGVRMQEMMGGGCAVVDIDLDGWPDLWCTQAGRWEDRGQPENPADELYRSRRGVDFVGVAEIAGVREHSYSQGIAVGDVNQDGFPDVYVANVGPNALFLNCGDGTFQLDQSDRFHMDHWTTSCAIADLNDDTFPEIYDVNYVGGEEAFQRFCRGHGVEHNCRPALFDPVQDQLLRNDGQGGFVNDTQDSGIVAPDGYGLGIVVGDFDQAPGLDLFVANDFSANFLFVNRSKKGRLSFVESGLSSGVAVDESGRFQACMGVAALDVDNNGRTDLFVTNFSDESNTLYLQTEIGLFSDGTRAAKLRDTGFDLVGFGAQSPDADNDGDEDLIFVNGALGKSLPATSGAIGMRACLMINEAGIFRESLAVTAGHYFEVPHLGRGLSCGDFNRDGASDCVVSNLDSPAALLMNTCSDIGASLRLRCVAAGADRRGIGTTVVVSDEQGQTQRSLTAGSGYMAANDNQFIVGTGRRKNVDLEIRWASGARSTFSSVATGTDWIATEDGRLWPAP
ncbi:MAG: FG-GAP-like repeat-containing protein [Planctomycetaceae bacterium]